MITEDYVTLEIAKLLNTKDFKEEFHKHYWGYEPGKEFLTDGSFNPEYDYPAPTLQMAIKWLREVHKLCITIIPRLTDDDGSGGCLWEWSITYHLVPQSISLELFESYEQACELAIKYCLENLI